MLTGERSGHCIQMEIKELMNTMIEGTLALNKKGVFKRDLMVCPVLQVIRRATLAP